MNCNTSPTPPAITPADLTAIWEDLQRWVRYAEGNSEEAYDSEERYLAKVGIDAAWWNLADLHGALTGPGTNTCRGSCDHLSAGLSEEALTKLLANLERGLANAAAKIADPRLRGDGYVHQRYIERLRDALLKARRTPDVCPSPSPA